MVFLMPFRMLLAVFASRAGSWLMVQVVHQHSQATRPFPPSRFAAGRSPWSALLPGANHHQVQCFTKILVVPYLQPRIQWVHPSFPRSHSAASLHSSPPPLSFSFPVNTFLEALPVFLYIPHQIQLQLGFRFPNLILVWYNVSIFLLGDLKLIPPLACFFFLCLRFVWSSCFIHAGLLPSFLGFLSVRVDHSWAWKKQSWTKCSNCLMKMWRMGEVRQKESRKNSTAFY